MPIPGLLPAEELEPKCRNCKKKKKKLQQDQNS